MIGTGDLKKGITIELDNQLYTILDWQHIKVGRGSAQVRLKLRDIRAGHIIDKSFQAGDKFNQVRIERRRASYLYPDVDLYYFMDVENFEQIIISKPQLGVAINYLTDGQEVDVLKYGEEAIGIELPLSIKLVVAETGPSFKGNTAQGGSKPATMETGLVVHVPLFVNNGDTISIDTRDGSYLERIS